MLTVKERNLQIKNTETRELSWQARNWHKLGLGNWLLSDDKLPENRDYVLISVLALALSVYLGSYQEPGYVLYKCWAPTPSHMTPHSSALGSLLMQKVLDCFLGPSGPGTSAAFGDEHILPGFFWSHSAVLSLTYITSDRVPVSTFESRALAGGQASVPCASDGRVHRAAASALHSCLGPGFLFPTQQAVRSALTPSAVIAKQWHTTSSAFSGPNK